MSSSGSEGGAHSNSRDKTAEKSQADILRDKKAKLRKDIEELERLNFQIECSLNISKFGDIKHLLTYPESVAHPSTRNIPDIETEHINELFQLTGMHCSHIGGNNYVFDFGHTYAIQIINTSEEPKVGKWVMPMSVNLNSILLETPLNNAEDLKPFLLNCKHYIDCYTNRVEQYNKLKSIVDDLSGCFLDTSLQYTKITLRFHNMRDVETAELHNIILALIYESNRVRPHKIMIDSMSSEELANSTADKFKTFFKSFKSLDLETAFAKTIGAENAPVMWQREDQDEPDSNDSSASSSEMNSATKKRKQRKKQTKPRSKTATRTSLPSNSLPNEEHSSDDSDLEAEPLEKRRKKSVEKRGKKQATQNKGKKAAGVTKKKSKPTKNANNNNPEPGANVSKGNLRQSTLAFQTQPLQRVDDVPLSERVALPSASGISVTKQKAKSNVTLLGNREFGTSTPFSRLNPSDKRFEADNTYVSPIKSKNNTVSKEK